MSLVAEFGFKGFLWLGHYLVFALAIWPSGRLEVGAATANKSANGESHFTTLDGARIHYVNYGKGSEALVLIHGWTMNLDSWRDQVSDFAKRNRVIVIELPGHGQSDKPQITYSMDLFARAVDAVLRDAKVKRAVLVGHSMGTPVARQFYRKYPAQTLAIVIVDGALRPFFADERLAAEAAFRPPEVTHLGRLLGCTPLTVAELVTWLGRGA